MQPLTESRRIMNDISPQRERFERLAETRVSKAMHAIRLVGNLSNRSNYEYSNAEARQMIGAIEDAVADLKSRFKASESRGSSHFELKRVK